ncbi:MAG: toll/interleukin-1 receptor domain-containing protein [Verrucomicrobiota bacterium]|nr:toll/interleukin-1 receptor domain-containing protein [Verrucomicrobiota bacterium]
MFFLKCLNDDDELDQLITREIEARNFFLYCDSHEARASKWVQREVAFIRSLPNRVWRTVDLDADPLAQLRAIRELSRSATIFLSYAHADWPVVAPIHDALVAAEYRVWSDVHSLLPGDSWENEITEALTQAIDEGFVLLFLSRNSLSSEFCRREAHSALELAATHPRGEVAILPIILGDAREVIASLPENLRERQFLDLGRSGRPEDAANRIISHLRRASA